MRKEIVNYIRPAAALAIFIGLTASKPKSSFADELSTNSTTAIIGLWSRPSSSLTNVIAPLSLPTQSVEQCTALGRQLGRIYNRDETTSCMQNGKVVFVEECVGFTGQNCRPKSPQP